MPVQLPNASLDQPHLDPGHLLGDRQVSNSHLTRPSPGFNALERIAERVLERWLAARIGCRGERRIGF